MRTWRVGTISMGIMLITLGIYLLLSVFFGWEFMVTYGFVSWWPILLIVLGVEILVYLYRSKQDKPVIKYDFLSVFFIAIIGLAGIGLFVAQETGILPKVRAYVNQEVRIFDLPTFNEQVDPKIEQIILQTGPGKVNVESMDTDKIAIFGTYRANVSGGEVPIEDSKDYLLVEIVGNSIYITVKNNFQDYRSEQMTIVIPSHVNVEIEANDESIDIYPRQMEKDWFIKNAHTVNVVTDKDANFTIVTNNIDENESNHERTVDDERIEENTEETIEHSSFGEGLHEINITTATNVNVITK